MVGYPIGSLQSDYLRVEDNLKQILVGWHFWDIITVQTTR